MMQMINPHKGETESLNVKGLAAGYGGKTILFGVDFSARRGSVVLFIGHNGAGKSTVLKALMGLLPGASGEIVLDGTPLGRPNVRRNIRAGMNIVLQHQGLFPNLSVIDNLALGAYSTGLPRRLVRQKVEQIVTQFPRLRERAHHRARLLSGGEQRMLSIGIAMMSEPRILLIDEPSAGLSPQMVEMVMSQIRTLQQDAGATILLVEQNVRAGLEIANTVEVIRLGRSAGHYEANDLRSRDNLWELF
jgi:branched-chain amino acid transport system ATP-binding protein